MGKKITFNKKNIIISMIIVIFLLILFGGIYIYVENSHKVAVLGFHGVLPEEINNTVDGLTLNLDDFEEKIKILHDMGYETLSLDDFYCWKNNECKKKHKSVLITFDDGWYNNYEYAFDVLKKYDMKAVVFCIGSRVDNNAIGYFV